MFDTKQVASHIKSFRIKKNMTQMNLADDMGVSYQAVSNWERGNSMPDISKLEDLAHILNCSIDDLLGSTKETEVVKNILNMQEYCNSEEINLQDMTAIAPILQPNQTQKILENIILSENKIEINDIILLAPFMGEDAIASLLDKVDILDNMYEIVGLAPFLSESTLETVTEKILEVNSLNEIVGLAPFLSEQSLDRLVTKVLDQGNIDECVGLYPFLSSETLQKLADKLVKNKGIAALTTMAPFL